jgi:stearoyl-CoA desaturase (delta-9 desaturase)
MSPPKENGMSEEGVSQSERLPVNWLVVVSLSFFHLGAIAAFFHFSWSALATAVALYWVAGSMGIGMGYHRLLTHRGYKTPKAVEYLLTVCGTLALEGGPIDWVVTHRVHHAYSDKDGDPHSPRDGRWWAHMGWLLVGQAQEFPEPVKKRFAPDLMKDPVHLWINRFYALPVVLLGLALAGFGGWPLLTWGLFLRTVVGLHATWLVNSATHLWGKRRFATRDNSRNNWWVALLTFGEGWHNNHHAHPASARHGLAWYEIDINWWGIRALQLLGLAKSIHLARIKDPIPQTDAVTESAEKAVVF